MADNNIEAKILLGDNPPLFDSYGLIGRTFYGVFIAINKACLFNSRKKFIEQTRFY
jgi:hypothetical protein